MAASQAFGEGDRNLAASFEENLASAGGLVAERETEA
jgi:hypothetical protein